MALASPPVGRSYFAGRFEKPLWKRWNRPKRLLLLTAILLLIANFLVFPLLPIPEDILSDQWTVIIAIASLAAALSLAAIRTTYVVVKTRSLAKSRQPMPFEEFVFQSPRVHKCDPKYSKVIREVLGFVYRVNAEIIYPTDTPESLGLLGELHDPYAFEVVLGVANRLAIKLSDSQVDDIIGRLYGNARKVEDLIAGLSEQLAAVDNSSHMK
jgi:hypothetical protein